VVKDVQICEQKRYHSFQQSVGHDVFHRPWRAKLRRLAKSLAADAQRCLDERRNEAEWRDRIESQVLGRLSIEVAW
jgi:hypothetical protein